jgi:hypothetical protein
MGMPTPPSEDLKKGRAGATMGEHERDPMKTKLYSVLTAAGALLLSGCASQMISDLNKAFDSPTKVASGDKIFPVPGPYIAAIPSVSHPPATFPSPSAANIGPGLR